MSTAAAVGAFTHFSGTAAMQQVLMNMLTTGNHQLDLVLLPIIAMLVPIVLSNFQKIFDSSNLTWIWRTIVWYMYRAYEKYFPEPATKTYTGRVHHRNAGIENVVYNALMQTMTVENMKTDDTPVYIADTASKLTCQLPETSTATVVFEHEGHKFTIEVDKSKTVVSENREREIKNDSLRISLRCVAAPNLGFDPVKEYIQYLFTKYNNSRSARRAYCNEQGKWREITNFRNVSDLNKICLGSLTGLITAVINAFNEKEASTDEAERAKKTVMMFYGPPGTGKTGTAYGIANACEKPVYILTLTKGMTCAEFNGLVKEVPTGSEILIEEIDTNNAFRRLDRQLATDSHGSSSSSGSRGQQSSGSSSELLNAQTVQNFLDGNIGCQGCMIILTTNNEADLNTTTVRDGRVDVKCHFGYADVEQITGLFKLQYKDDFPPEHHEWAKTIASHNITPATVSRAFLRAHLNQASPFSEEYTNMLINPEEAKNYAPIPIAEPKPTAQQQIVVSLAAQE
jgi:hypothetical protein